MKEKDTVSTVKKFLPRRGILSPEELSLLSEAMKKHGATGLRLSGGALEIVAPEGELKDFCRSVDRWLKPVEIQPGKAKSCRGLACRNGMRDAPQMAGLLLQKTKEFNLPGKFRIGVSACPNNCAGGPVRDLGLFATARGWTVMVGGSAGRNPRLADRIASGLDDSQALELAERVLTAYSVQGRPGERTGALIRRCGPGIFTIYSDVYSKS